MFPYNYGFGNNYYAYASYPCDIIKLYFMDQRLKTLNIIIIMHGSIYVYNINFYVA